MAWSFPIARFYGTEVRIHLTFFLLLLWFWVSYYHQGGTAAAVEGTLFIIALFACVVAHEFGHALTARIFGIRTPDITLLPIGGVARLERMPEKPSQEILVAVAGPAVNVVIAAVLILIIGGRANLGALENIDSSKIDFVTRLAAVNLFLVLFNMIPAFPMDGGRVLRAILAIYYPRKKATRIAAHIGQGLAFVFGFLGLMGNPILIFIALFVYLAATAEAHASELQAVARHVSIGDAMITKFETLGPNSIIGDAADAVIRTTQHEFPVVDGSGRLRGILTRDAIIGALNKSGPSTPVLEVMSSDIPTLEPGGRLEKALQILQTSSAPGIGVNDAAGRFVGYITAENITELMMIDVANER
jgi:Zn-dependent protease/CBS domain-containing protein